MKPGKLIVVEGTDCSGKATQTELLVKSLIEKEKKAIRLTFPMYDTPTGKILGGPVLGNPNISSCWFDEGYASVDAKVTSLYFAADRKYNIDKVREYLNQGYYVILDRYTSSNMAHQGSKIENKDDRFYFYQWIDKLEYWLLELPKADLTIFLHVPSWLSYQLKKNREVLDEAETNEEHLKRSEEAYVELSELYHWTVIECEDKEKKEIRTIESIHQEILSAILQEDK